MKGPFRPARPEQKLLVETENATDVLRSGNSYKSYLNEKQVVCRVGKLNEARIAVR